MFTIQQIHSVAQKVKSGSDFPQFIQDLKELGVCSYDQYVSDGHTQYYGVDFLVTDDTKYPIMEVAENSSVLMLKNAITIHQQGETDYHTFCVNAANSGVGKWRTSIEHMNVEYVDKRGVIILVEPIPLP